MCRKFCHHQFCHGGARQASDPCMYSSCFVLVSRGVYNKFKCSEGRERKTKQQKQHNITQDLRQLRCTQVGLCPASQTLTSRPSLHPLLVATLCQLTANHNLLCGWTLLPDHASCILGLMLYQHVHHRIILLSYEFQVVNAIMITFFGYYNLFVQ